MNLGSRKKGHSILVYDDHPIIGESLKLILNRVDSIESVVSVSCYKEAIDTIRTSDFDLLILDVNLDSSDGYQFLKRAKSYGYNGKAIYFTCNSQDYCAKVAYELGANGYLDKSESQEVIIAAVKTVLSGYNFFKLDQTNMLSETPDLSNREVMVLNYLLKGKSNNDVADILGISPKTVSTYKRRLLSKYGVSSLFELVEINERI